MMKNTLNQRNQMQWIVLLALAVVLPTVSLLWFMSRVVVNERLAVQQKLATIYQGQLDEAGERVNQRFHERFDAYNNADWARDPYGLLRRLVLDEHFQAVVLWGPDGKLIYPSASQASGSGEMSSGPLADAWQLEFLEHNHAAAAERYGQLADSADPRALAGLVRCLIQLGRWDEAMDAAIRRQDSSAAPARLLLLSQLLKEPESQDRKVSVGQLVQRLDNDLFKAGEDHLPAQENQLIYRRLLESLKASDESESVGSIAQLAPLADAESLSLTLAASWSQPVAPVDEIVRILLDDRSLYYAVHHPTPFGEMMVLLSSEGLASVLDGYRLEFKDSDARFRILDTRGNLIAGDPGVDISAIASALLPQGFPEGRVELFFANGDVFSRAAGRQITVYIWTGALVILLILAVAALAVQAIGRQIRLNKMKNDFIATVSHELRTPLASMRLLVDTLLEKRVRDEEHAEQYLRLVARENERLTRMIENFLTFSRMERNKNAFTLAMTSPAAIAADAVDSVRTKFEANHCRLETHIAEDLPDIPADHDAIVTVLINLLDNACKYTAENKQIGLTVSAEDGEVYFAVSDNGVGLSRRQVRRIFDSFYQVDSSLARTVEGCGLGLSIVQFIVNAHKGRIEVDSEPGRGSTFTVRLPAAPGNKT